MQTCQKLDRSRAPQARNNEELVKLRKYMAEVFHIPGTIRLVLLHSFMTIASQSMTGSKIL